MPASRHDLLKAPKDTSQPIWRYMDFTKFVSMLDSSSLYFSRADCLGDPFEGSLSRANEKLRPVVYKDNPEILQALPQLSSFLKQLTKETYISCWHMNGGESAAMWKLYAQTNEAVAVRSTFARLFNQLSSDVFMGIVEYVDYNHDWMGEGNALFPYVHKRISFSHENEVRAIIQNIKDRDPSPPKGLARKVDLTQLIDAVYVAPTCADWFQSLTESVCHRYGLPMTVIRSSLDEAPFY